MSASRCVHSGKRCPPVIQHGPKLGLECTAGSLVCSLGRLIIRFCKPTIVAGAFVFSWRCISIIIPSHLFFNREGRWGTTDDFATSFLHFSLFSAALWDLANSRPVHSLMLSSNLFLCLPCFLLPFTVPCKMVLARPDERET